MAAVICKSIGELCNGIGQVICLPCKACGLGCDALGDVLRSPFFPYLALTFCLNVPAIYYGGRSLLEITDCASVGTWMLSNGVLCLIHIFAAVYIVNTIREQPPEDTVDPETGASTNYTNFSVPKKEEHGAANSFARIKYVLCYDKIMALYIVVFIGWVIWLTIGIGRRLQAEDDGCDDVVGYLNIVIMCGYLYLSMVGVAFACSLCCLR